MWLWLLAVVLLAGIWVGGHFLQLALWIEILATVGVVLFVVAVLVYRRWRAGAAARALEQELMKQAEAQAAGTRPDRRAEIFELQARMKSSLNALKSSKLGASGASAMYALPWYVIVGPPGAGKTTALRHSGLEFPLEDGGVVKGTGGTRNCDWWLSNEAILLDTAGRYATQEDDREEWFAFLDTLRKHRSQKPINGVIVAVSLADIAGASEEQLDTMAKTMRARIDEIMTRLAMVVPVYVMFTKADLIAGFIEFWENLKKSERAQIWGATFPLDGAAAADPAKLAETEFDALVRTLHAQALRRISLPRSAEARARILHFPVEMQAMRGALTDFLGTLFRRNTFQETPIFRGMYFSSGTQEGRPLDRVMAGMARAFGLRSGPSEEEGQAGPVEPKSYFLTDLFRRVMFPDQNVAARTKGETRRQLLIRLATVALGLLFAIILLLPALISFKNNNDLASTSSAIGEKAAGMNLTPGPDVEPKLAPIEPLRERLEMLKEWERNGRPFGYGWGMYAGERVYGPLRDEYAAILRKNFALPAQKQLEERLRSMETMGDNPTDAYNRHYDQLKSYLMLTETEHLDPEWASLRLARVWQGLLGAKEADVEPLRRHARMYLDLVKAGEIAPLSRDERLVSYARSELLRVPRVGRVYENLVRDANAEIAAIRRENIFYGAVAPYVTSKRNVKVDGAYTKLGWIKVKALLDSAKTRLVAESWVLGSNEQISEEETARQVAQLRQVYFDRFRDQWRDFFLDLEVQQPPNTERALEELLALTEPEWPYMRLIRILHENVTLEIGEAEKDAGIVEKVLDRAAEEARKRVAAKDAGVDIPGGPEKKQVSSVERAYKPITSFGVPAEAKPGAEPPPTGLSQYQAILRKLVGVLSDLRDGKAKPDPKAVTEEFQNAFRATNALLADQDAFTRPLLTPLLLQPVTMSWASVVRDAGGAAGGLWEVDVWKPWANKLENNFPFKETALTDATLEDYSAFFAPKAGILWKFYDEHLKGTLDKEGDHFTSFRRFKATAGYRGAFLECLKNAQKITTATFEDETGKVPLVTFEVNLHSVSPDVSEVTIEIDGVSHTYKNAPEEWMAASWPAKAAKQRGAKVQVRGFSGLSEEIVRAGDFGLYRLLAASEMRAGTAGGKPGEVPTIVATWRLRAQPGSSVQIDIRPGKSGHPFGRGFFSTLRCPRVIQGGLRVRFPRAHERARRADEPLRGRVRQAAVRRRLPADGGLRRHDPEVRALRHAGDGVGRRSPARVPRSVRGGWRAGVRVPHALGREGPVHPRRRHEAEPGRRRPSLSDRHRAARAARAVRGVAVPAAARLRALPGARIGDPPALRALARSPRPPGRDQPHPARRALHGLDAREHVPGLAPRRHDRRGLERAVRPHGARHGAGRGLDRRGRDGAVPWS